MFTDAQNKMLLAVNAAIQSQRGVVSPEDADAVVQMAAAISYMARSDYRVPRRSVALDVTNELIAVARQAMDQKLADLAARGVVIK
jgi:hypothetical protein